MAARYAWKGALEVSGFPVNIALYPRVKSRSGESFKTLAPNGQPVRSVYLDSDDQQVSRDETSKGIEVEGEWKVLPPEAVEQIASAERTTVAPPAHYSPRASVPVELADKAFVVGPDDKVAGAETSYGVLWNGLIETDRVYVTQVTLRAGSRDAVLVLYAEEDGLVYGAALPFADELHPLPEFRAERNEQAAALFAQATEGMVEEFDLGAFKSAWRERRTAAIEAATSGKPVKVTEAPEPKAETPDLMAALEAAAKAPAKKAKSRKKVAA